MISKYFTLTIILFTIIIRFIFIFTPSFKIDMNTWEAWSSRLVNLTPINFYAPNYFSDYLPGYLYILWGIGILYKIVFPSLSFTNDTFSYLLKSITTIFDFLTAWYIYKIIASKNKSWASVSGLFYLLNPALIFNTAIWGQVDGVVTFFMIYSSYLLIILKKPLLWGLIFGITFLIKPQSIIILPVMAIYLYYNFSVIQFIQTTFITIFSIFIFSIPFFLKDPLFGLVKQLVSASNQYPYTSLYAFNFWSLASWWKPDNLMFLLIPYQTWGYLLIILCLILIILPIIKNKTTLSTIFYLGASLSIIAFFLFPTRIHERYLFPFFAFFIIVAGLKKSKLSLIIYFLLSIIHLSNLWYVYVYYNDILNNPSFHGNQLFDMMTNIYPELSLVTLILFGVLLFKYYRNIYEKNL